MRIYDTATRALVALGASNPVRIYNCGPTVYADAHLGHARNALVYDTLVRYLRWTGREVFYVRNYTDIDDKLIARAVAEGTTVAAVAGRYIDAYELDLGRLGCLLPDAVPRATEHVPEMLALIKALITRGRAYESAGDVYFSVAAFEGYGALSGRRIEDLRAGARVEPGEAKRAPQDFALWKASEPGEPSWESPWGPGRPGWHIECSAMSEKYLGASFDLHGGGLDLVFPHHENERAQSQAARSDPSGFARIWMHHGLVTQAGQKLSKSVGGYQSLPDMVSKHEPAALRLLTLQTHYRKPIDLSQAIVAEAERSWKRLVDAYWRFSSAHPGGDGETIKTEWRDRVVAAMDEDMNTAGALAAIYDLVRAGHSALDDGGRTGPLWAAEFSDLARAIGLDVTAARATGGDEDSSDAVEALLAERVSARAERDFARADAIRTQLANDGIVIEDTPAGTTWYRA